MFWDQEVQTEETPKTLSEMDALVEQIVAARAAYDTAKEASSVAHAEKARLEKKMIDYLKAARRSSYDHPALGKASFYAKETYETPKTSEDKTMLFGYILEKYGNDALTSMLGINHQTLNSWANKEVESGEVMDIPGLGQPTIVEVFSFRKGK